MGDDEETRESRDWYTPEEAAAILCADGLDITADEIRELRSGQGRKLGEGTPF
jgi:hypothetical protein